MTPRQILVAVALGFVLIGLFAGQKSHTVSNGSLPIKCGSVFNPSGFESGLSDNLDGGDSSGDCKSKLSDAKPLTYGALGLAGIALIIAIVAPGATPKRDEQVT